MEEYCDDSQYYEQVNQKTTKPSKSIYAEIADLPYQEDIKRAADAFYGKMECGIKRKRKRVQLLFFCLYQAHKMLGRPVDPISIAKVLGLKKGKMNKAISMFSEIQTKCKTFNNRTYPQELIPKYCEIMELGKTAEAELIILIDKLIEKAPGLLEKSPQAVCSGAIKYYTNTLHGYEITNSMIHKCTGLSDPTINSMHSLIIAIDASTKTYPHQLLPKYCESIGFDNEAKQDIANMCQKIIKKDSSLLEKPPQIICAAVMKYYAIIQGMDVEYEVLSDCTGARIDVIKAMVEYINGLNLENNIQFVDLLRLLANYAIEIGFNDEGVHELDVLCKKIIEIKPDIVNKPPQVLIASLITYYVLINDIDIEAGTVNSFIGVPDESVQELLSEIDEILNNTIVV